jgi:pyrophosphatase PpaX
MRFPVVLFDFDGTLVDSGWIILSSFRHATRTVLEREIPDDVLVRGIGGSGIVEQMAAIDADRVDDLVRVYREHNEPLHDELEAFAGTVELLEELHGEGRRLGIVTAKRRPTVQLAFDRLGLERWFDAVVTRELTEHGKPHPGPVLKALELLGATAAEAAFVGDSPFDMGAGRAAGVFTVGVSWGGIHDPAVLLDEGADVVVDTLDELRDAIR